jgi:hypothetical protein
MRRFVPRGVRRLLEGLLRSLRPTTEIAFLHTDFNTLGLGWHSYMNAVPPSMVVRENEPFSLGRVHAGPLLLQVELPDDVDRIERGPDDYGPLLFLLHHVRRAIRHIKVTLSRSKQLGHVHVRVQADHDIASFDQDVPVHYVDDDTGPHVVLENDEPQIRSATKPNQSDPRIGSADR